MGIYVGAKVFLIYEVRCRGPRPRLWWVGPVLWRPGNTGGGEEGCGTLFCQGDWSLFSLRARPREGLVSTVDGAGPWL